MAAHTGTMATAGTASNATTSVNTVSTGNNKKTVVHTRGVGSSIIHSLSNIGKSFRTRSESYKKALNDVEYRSRNSSRDSPRSSRESQSMFSSESENATCGSGSSVPPLQHSISVQSSSGWSQSTEDNDIDEVLFIMADEKQAVHVSEPNLLVDKSSSATCRPSKLHPSISESSVGLLSMSDDVEQLTPTDDDGISLGVFEDPEFERLRKLQALKRRQKHKNNLLSANTFNIVVRGPSLRRHSSVPDATVDRFFSSPVVTETTTIDADSGSDEESEKRVNQYVVHEVLGRGAFGVVRRVMDIRDNKMYAMKELSKKHMHRKQGIGRPNLGMMRKNKGPTDDVLREIAILKELNHPNIVKLWEVMEDRDCDSMFMIFELSAGGSVMDIGDGETTPLHQDKAWKYFRHLVCGLEYLHAKCIIHRDIKPDNLLLSEDDNLQITDFGVSEIGKDVLTRSVGSVAFWAPEMCSSTVTEYEGKPIDIWAIGVTLHVFLYGRLPFHSPTMLDLFKVICETELVLPNVPDDIPEICIDLMHRMLCKDPLKRITLGEVKEHVWVTNGGEHVLPELGFKPYENISENLKDVSSRKVRSSIRRVRMSQRGSRRRK